MIKDFRFLNFSTWGCIGFVIFLFLSTALRFLAQQYPVLNLILLTILFLGIAIFIWIVLSPQFAAPLKLDAIETAAVVAVALVFAYGDAIVRFDRNRKDHDSAPTPEQPQREKPPVTPGAPYYKAVDAVILRPVKR